MSSPSSRPYDPKRPRTYEEIFGHNSDSPFPMPNELADWCPGCGEPPGTLHEPDCPVLKERPDS